MINLPPGVDIDNLIDDLKIFSWEASEMLLYYASIIKYSDDKRKIIKNGNDKDRYVLLRRL